VIVCDTIAEAEAAIDVLFATEAGKTLIIEEKLTGPEITVMMLIDGKSWAALPLSQDHKRLSDGDTGPNTGGMGALCPVPLDVASWQTIAREVLDPTLHGLRKSGFDYRGALYAGIMMTPDGPKVLEYNARFGDPETQAVLPLLEGDLLQFAFECGQQRLRGGVLPVKPGACVGVTLSSPGYPASVKTGTMIDLNGADTLPETLIFHAGTKKTQTGWVATGGRVLTVVGQGLDIPQARARAYEAIARIRAPGLHFRTDIATKALGRTVKATKMRS
jgi:phosphoribosylamine--glycine ligase